MRRVHLILLALAPGVLAGCSGTPLPALTGGGAPERAVLSEVQECAIGYDMARRIYELVRVRGTVIRLAPDLGDCGRHAARYLRRAGFAVDETAPRSNARSDTRSDTPAFTMTTFETPAADTVIVTTSVPGLRLTRAYWRAETGVLPASGWTLERGED